VRIVLDPLDMSPELLLMLRFVLSLGRLPLWSRMGVSARMGVPVLIGMLPVPVAVLVDPVARGVVWVVEVVVPFVPGCVVPWPGSTRALSGVGTGVWAYARPIEAAMAATKVVLASNLDEII